MINYEEINKFINQVFNYYNGRINVINRAILDINWIDFANSETRGDSRLPNIVTVYPMVAIKLYSTESDMLFSIIDTIIHELYHTDQLINYSLYELDESYHKYIEDSVYLQTALYMMGHIQEFDDVFGIGLIIEDNYNNILNKYSSGLYYRRRYFHDHVLMCLDELCAFDQDEYNQYYQAIGYIIENRRNLIIYINSDIIPAYTGIPMNIDEFNSIMHKYYYNISDNTIHIKIENDNLIIDIQNKPIKHMVKKV